MPEGKVRVFLESRFTNRRVSSFQIPKNMGFDFSVLREPQFPRVRRSRLALLKLVSECERSNRDRSRSLFQSCFCGFISHDLIHPLLDAVTFQVLETLKSWSWKSSALIVTVRNHGLKIVVFWLSFT
jgi:hypothetical protein